MPFSNAGILKEGNHMEPLKSTLRGVGMKKTRAQTSARDEASASVCPHCDGMGYVTHNVPIDHPDFGKAFPCVCQNEIIAERHENRLRKISNLEAYSHFRFDNFELRTQELNEVQATNLHYNYERALNYANNPAGWLLIHGGYGCGKTHLAAAIGNKLLEEGHEVIFVTVPDMLDHLRMTFVDSSEVNYDEVFEKVKNAPILVLDDLGAESPTPWAGEKLFQLLNHRYVRRLTTIITTNFDLEDLDGRIRSRLHDNSLTQQMNMQIPDFRRAAIEHGLDLANLQLYDNMLLENFYIRKDGSETQRKSLRDAHEKATAFASMPTGFLIFWGEHGTGKTHLAAGIANHCRKEDDSVLFVHIADLLDFLRASLSSNRTTNFKQSFSDIRRANLLIIDDFHTKSSSSWAEEKLFQIIEFRYLSKLATVITLHTEAFNTLDKRFIMRFSDTRTCTMVPIDASSFFLEKGPHLTVHRNNKPPGR